MQPRKNYSIPNKGMDREKQPTKVKYQGVCLHHVMQLEFHQTRINIFMT